MNQGTTSANDESLNTSTTPIRRRSLDSPPSASDCEAGKRWVLKLIAERQKRDTSSEFKTKLRTQPATYHGTGEEPVSFRVVSLLWLGGIFLLAVPIVTMVDLPVAVFWQNQPADAWWMETLNHASEYARGTGVFLSCVAILLWRPKSRWSIPRLASLALGAGAVATLAKLVVLRPRPGTVGLDNSIYDSAWIWKFDWTLSQIANFDPAIRAFPSASLANATALTVGLVVVIPRWKTLSLSLWTATLIQRSACGAHFLSDLFGSISVGLGWAYVCFHPSLMGRIFDRLEATEDRRTRRRKAATERREARKRDRQESAPSKAA
ncbi:MAG: phosphatase PAP2 family protein [Planctomycetota bacterium]